MSAGVRGFLLFCAGGIAPVAVGQSLSFSDVGPQVGVTFVHHDPDFVLPDNSWWVGSGAAAADYDLDGDMDFYVVDAFGYPNHLYRNNGDGTFTESAAQAGVADTGAGHMALFTDLDNDGDKDLIVANNTEAQPDLTESKLFRNNADGTFADVTAGSGFNPQGVIVGGMTVTDYNEDGRLDIYIAYWDVEPGTPQNNLYRNEGNFIFSEVTESAGLRPSSTQTYTWSPVFADFTGDGLQDLFGAVDFDPNYFFVHNGTGTSSFADRSNQADVRNIGNDMGAAIGDCNGDGLLDIYTTNITPEPPNEQDETNVLYINQTWPNSFTEEAIARGVWQTYWGWGTTFADVDLDGDLDLYAVGGRTDNDYYGNKPARLFINDGTGFYEEKSEECGADSHADSRGLLPFDFDADGDQDFLIVNVLSAPTLLENQTNHANHWLVVELVGATRSRDAIGAKVHLLAGETTQYREVIAGSSFFAGPPLQQHFGVGAALMIDEIIIDWPGGQQDVLINVPVDRKLILTEDQAPAPEPYALAIEGPSGGYENEVTEFVALTENYFSGPSEATTEATWSVLTSTSAAEFTSPGVLSIGEVEAEVDIEIEARLGDLAATQFVTLYDSETVDSVTPVVSIVEPTLDSTWNTSESVIVLEGSAVDNVAVVSATWSSSAGAGGPCNGTHAWSTGSISLSEGPNLITVTARDAAGNEGSAQLTVTYVKPVVVENENAPAAENDNQDGNNDNGGGGAENDNMDSGDGIENDNTAETPVDNDNLADTPGNTTSDVPDNETDQPSVRTNAACGGFGWIGLAMALGLVLSARRWV